MRISEQRKSILYAAISEPIMQQRITIKQSENVLGKKNVDDLDDALFRLCSIQWRAVCKALEIDNP